MRVHPTAFFSGMVWYSLTVDYGRTGSGGGQEGREGGSYGFRDGKSSSINVRDLYKGLRALKTHFSNFLHKIIRGVDHCTVHTLYVKPSKCCRKTPVC